MLGHQNLSEQSGIFMTEQWRYDVVAEADGYLAIFPFGELKQEIRRQANGCMKVLEIAARASYETTYYNITG